MAAAKSIEEIRALFPEELKEYMEKNQEGSYTLLDVRQPFEYEESHLPGAKLIPLPNLPDSLGEIDRRRPTVVYCRSGGRSQMAARLLMHQGFEDVRHLQGGMNAWEEPTATGPVEFHLGFVTGGEMPADIIKMAYRMEAGLKRFHEEVLARTDEEGFADLLKSLIKAEEKHMLTVKELGSAEGLGEEEFNEALEQDSGGLMEGGFTVNDFLDANEHYFKSLTGFLELAMMVETQAFDLYLRMAAECGNDESRKVLLRIAEEEKAHLAMLGRYLDQMGIHNS